MLSSNFKIAIHEQKSNQFVEWIAMLKFVEYLSFQCWFQISKMQSMSTNVTNLLDCNVDICQKAFQC